MPAGDEDDSVSQRTVSVGGLTERLGERGFGGDLDVVVLLTSELITNAVVHGDPPYALVIGIEPDGGVRVGVEDGAAHRLPALRPFDGVAPLESRGGRGLRLVDQLADVWGWNLDDGHAKRIWFTVAGP